MSFLGAAFFKETGVRPYTPDFYFAQGELTLRSCELHCQTLAPDGHLASFHWEEQSRIIGNSLPERTGLWIGLNDNYKEGAYFWTDGSSSDFVNWDSGQPDDYRGEEDCVHFVDPTINWNDLPCQSKLSFLCSYKLPSPYCH
ncbi:C-type lectin-like [Stegostoma tigrinum]|uniref:C-type lectin-like n=1 Tax=Stegostoma tigrinum TaxID=3053191 RepID=UPI00287011D1|nr:C-type lectin-like [Stegostoma tigrinum]